MNEIIESIRSAIIRFWDNRFTVEDRTNDEIRYLRIQLDIERTEKKRLLDLIIELQSPKSAVSEPFDENQTKPISSSRQVPWHIMRQRLEAEARNKARDLANEARVNIERNKTTEELEQELLAGEN